MNEKLNYISDEELEQLICRVEQEELVAAPPDLVENILTAAGLVSKVVEVKSKASKKKEFYAYCFRVVTSVAAAIALVFLLPELSGWIKQNPSQDFAQTVYKQTVPDYETVVAQVPGKEEVLAAKSIPSKEEVLDDTGFVERLIRNNGWLNQENNEQ